MAHLQDQLDLITENTRNLVQPERLAISDRAVEELFTTGIEQHILPVGAKAPEFELPDATGRTVRSQDLLALGPLVINFFRGRWCPYCVTELEAWRDLYPVVREQGGLVVAISPQTQRQSDFTAGSVGQPVRPDVLRARLSAELLPQHSGQHSFCEWGRELAAAAAGHLRGGAGWHGGVCRGVCRFSRAARAGRGAGTVAGPATIVPATIVFELPASLCILGGREASIGYMRQAAGRCPGGFVSFQNDNYY